MLPLDILDEQAEKILIKNGVSPDKITVAVKADLDHNEQYSISWLAYCASENVIYHFFQDGDIFEKIDLEFYKDPIIESLLGSNRLLYRKYSNKPPVIPEGTTEEEIARINADHSASGNTVIVCYASNSCKQKLFTFVNIITRLQNGDEVKEDDDIFKQFKKYCPKCGRRYENNAEVCSVCDRDKNAFLRVFKFYKPYIPNCIAILLTLLACSCIQLVTPKLQGTFLYDQVISPNGRFHSEQWVFITVGAIFLLAIINVLVQILKSRISAPISRKVADTMKKTMFEKIQSLSLSFFGKNSVGSLITRINSDAETIADFFGTQIPSLIFEVLTFIGMAVIIFTMNWKLSILIFIPTPIIFYIFRVRLPKYYKSFGKVWRARSSLNSMVNDSLTGIRVTKAFAKEVDESHRFYLRAEKLTNASIKAELVSITIFPVVSLIIGMASQAIWGFGGLMVMGEQMSYGDFVSYFGYVGLVFAPLNFFANFSRIVTRVLNSVQRYYEILDAKSEIIDSEKKIKIDKFKGEIELKDVNFSYIPNRPILKDVSMHINPGDHVGLVGHTGAGKSTIANLITRLYDPISGNIFIDGINIKDIDIASLRKNMAIVSQEIFIFRGSIADNIRYAKPDATIEEVIAAAKAANAHEFIMNMPQGYDTIVGIGSARAMSGGEQQRISIARAILLSPSILILDEATAAMDTETERLITKALDALVEGRTTISIAHRLSTLKGCNVLHAIENGEIAESGTHEELVAKRGIYYRLYTLQNEANKKIIIGE